MKKQTYVSDFLSKYTVKQLYEDEWNNADKLLPSRAHLRHKRRLKRAGRSTSKHGDILQLLN